MSGRPLTPDQQYAEKYGVSVRQVRRHGGAERLDRMTPEACALILKPKCKVGFAVIKKGGLAARGMGQRRGYKPKGYSPMDRGVEMEIRAILSERGLIK